jgi:hypothetical protein
VGRKEEKEMRKATPIWKVCAPSTWVSCLSVSIVKRKERRGKQKINNKVKKNGGRGIPMQSYTTVVHNNRKMM